LGGKAGDGTTRHRGAEDLVQEALTKAYVAWPRLHRVGNAEAYTRKIHGDQVSQEDAMWAELQALPPRQRAAIVPRYYAGFTEKETAEARYW
jgi:DNA-directed RNA polymerase specialized sigma24 family protein